jgi:hypothetical protein
MATDSVHSQGIRLQAERVVRAYRELRSTAHSATFTSDEFPVGQFAELVSKSSCSTDGSTRRPRTQRPLTSRASPSKR